MSIIHAIILAIVEGLTEFLPVSSTGHMIITSSLLGIASDPFTKTFTVAIQLGAILAVLALYWKKFIPSGGIGTIFPFYLKLAIAFIPAAIAGKLLDDYIDSLLENVTVVGCTLLAGGIIFLFIDKWFKKTENEGQETISNSSAFKIGLFQVIAMIPGVSRSAATIVGGLQQKLTRKAAAEFSFFLAVPTMFAATGYKLYKYHKVGGVFEPGQLNLLLIGNIVAFVVALLAIKTFISFLTKHGFKLFGYYRIGVGLLIILLQLLGIELAII